MSKKNNKKQETGGLQQPKMSVVEKEELKKEKQKVRSKEKKKKDKKEKSGKRFNPFVFLKGMFGELRRVKWPTFAMTVAKTGVVISVVLIFSIVLFGIDFGLSHLYDLLVGGL